MDPQTLFWIAPIGSCLALLFAFIFYLTLMSSDPGSERSQEIAGFVKEGAYAYLFAQYRTVGLFFVAAFAFFAFLAFVLKVQSPWTPIAFLTGGFFSGLSGFLGMKTATSASNRTAAAAAKSLNQGLQVAFRSGAVMGFVVVGLGLLDISIWWKIMNWVMANKETVFKEGFIGMFAVNNFSEATTIMLTFGMGASSQALFARVGGGIFTKAADVGADLVGKTEAGIPEDDPRNPAVIADNVGDNVGDVAGMGADLYESYCGSILATTALGAAAFSGSVNDQMGAIILPMAISGLGIIFSIIGVFAVSTQEDATQKDLMAALNKGINIASALTAIASIVVLYLLLPKNMGMIGSIIAGLGAGIIIGKSTEYYTSSDFEPTQDVAKQSTTGPATVIIEGMATGMISTCIPVVTVGIAVLFAYGFAGGFGSGAGSTSLGLYGIGIAAVGMLSTLGITLATDAYGPIADNAGGNAQMCHMDPEVRKRTDALDALGNTTAATGKGYAIGSAALTALALMGAYVEELRGGLLRVAEHSKQMIDKFIFIDKKAIPIDTASMQDFMAYYNVNLMNPQVLVGVFLGSMMVFVFCALSMKAVGRAAHAMVEEVRRQFKDIPGLLKGEAGAKPDYSKCVEISTLGAQKEMVVPSLMAIIVPIVTGLFLGASGVMGLLMGGMATGFVVAIMMANAGGTWDNAKKYVESGQLGGKGSDCHKATVVGDTVGDPFKDTCGPSLNILIKLMSMVAVVAAGLTVSYSPEIQNLIGFNPSERRFKENARQMLENGQMKLPDLKGRIASGTEDEMLDEEDRLLGSEEILPEDDEGLLGEDLASDTLEEELASGTPPKAGPGTAVVQPVTPPPPPATVAPTPAATVKPAVGGFDGLDTPKPTEKPTVKPSSGGFDGLDSPKPADVTPPASPAPVPLTPAPDAVTPAPVPATPAPAQTQPPAAVTPDVPKPADVPAHAPTTAPVAPATVPAVPASPSSGGFDGF